MVTALLACNNPSQILQKHEQVHRVGRRGDEIESLIKIPRFFIFGVHCKSAYAGNVSRPQCSLHRVFQQRFADALTLPAPVHRQARQEHDRDRVACQTLSETLRSFLTGNLANCKRMVADDNITGESDIGLCCSRQLIRPGIATQRTVQLFATAIKALYCMIRAKLFYNTLCAQRLSGIKKIPVLSEGAPGGAKGEKEHPGRP